MRQNLRHVLIAHELVADGCSILSCDHDIQIADRVAPPPIAAGHDHMPAIAEKTYQRLRLGFGHGQLETFLGRRLFESGCDFLLDGRTEPF